MAHPKILRFCRLSLEVFAMTMSWRDAAIRVLNTLRTEQAESGTDGYAKCHSVEEVSEYFEKQLERIAFIPAIEGALRSNKYSVKRLLGFLEDPYVQGVSIMFDIFSPTQEKTTWGLVGLLPFYQEIKNEFEIQ